jgi:hypothetical protein
MSVRPNPATIGCVKAVGIVLMLNALTVMVPERAGLAVAQADAVAYLFNVTVRPGYGFADANAALTYGHGICDKIGQGETFAHLVQGVEADLSTTDEYQATYLISQAANELCPNLIWQLRQSAAQSPVAQPTTSDGARG